MEGLVKGLEGVALGDAVEGAESRRDRRAGAAPVDWDREGPARSTWAEVASEEKRGAQERGWESVEHDRKQQQQHIPAPTQWHNQDEGGEMMGGGSDGATGIGHSGQRLQTSQCGTERQVHICSVSALMVIFAHYHLARIIVMNLVMAPWFEMLGCTRAKLWRLGDRGRKEESQKITSEWKRYKRLPSEQEYSEDVSHIHHGLNVEPTREELDHLSKTCARLWELDLNRLTPGKDYTIECGEGKKVYHKGDKASENLFSWLEDSVLRRPTYSRFCALLDNYNPHQGYKEPVTQQDKHEEAAFIEEISRSAPIKYLHRYLVMKEAMSQDYEDFKKVLTSPWFDLCGRGGCSSSSSAFEHVFVGEIKGQKQAENEVSGFHNWIQFYLEESNGNVDYKGYIFPRRRGELPDSETQLLTIQFDWRGVLKSVSSTLIGVSPEFEIALYTLCFFAGGGDNHVDIGPYSVNIKCYRLGDNKIGSAFPIAAN
ncbi:poly(U)-specific endoribonuclease-B-like isoform X2 [Panicum virgatum]|uniref:poly(U)-specific endoribonuclease-B-like isoform X2 n=1 Tax=Panicum virgatum TaxID=38727 RepID=UPI0019D5F326|nr:poly(U)-specific endoribonuclease-B-like isoform X2 [Panicum virgatum]